MAILVVIKTLKYLLNLQILKLISEPNPEVCDATKAK